MPDAAPIQNFNPLCDSTLVHCLEIDHFAGHFYGHLQVLPRTDRRDAAAVFPLGFTLGLFGRIAGGISTSYTFWKESDAVYQQLGPLRLNLTGRLLPLSSSNKESPDGPSRRFQLGLAYEHEVRVGPFSGANSLGLLTDLASFYLIASKWLGPFQLSISAGGLFDWRGSFATGSLGGQLGFLIPGFKQLKVFVGALGRGFPVYVKRDVLPLLPDGRDPIQSQALISTGLAFRLIGRVDLGVEVQRGFGGGIAPWVVSVNFLVISFSKQYQGQMATPIAQLAADVTVEAGKAIAEFISTLPIDPKLDESCIILDNDLSVMGRFGKRNGYYCEQDGFKVPIGHELLRDKKGDRLCRGSRKNPTTGKRELTDCLLERHGKEWVPIHRPQLDGACRMIDNDGTVLGVLGEPTEDGKRCRYLGERQNGAYGKYMRYEEQPIGEEFHTDADRTAVCLDAAMKQCFMRPPPGRRSLAWNKGERASTALVGGFEGGLKEQGEDAKGIGQTVKDVATGTVKVTTILEAGRNVAKQKLDGAKELLNDPEKRKEVVEEAEKYVQQLGDALDAWSQKSPEEQMEDVLGAAGKSGSYMATGVVTGGVGRIAGQGVKVAAAAGKGARTAQRGASGAARAEKALAKQARRAAAEAPTPQGGTYVLVDKQTDQVMRTGRTNDLRRRQQEHKRAPETAHLEFETDKRTNNRSERRGREQLLHDQHQPPLDKINPISPKNPRRQEYLDAAQRLEISKD